MAEIDPEEEVDVALLEAATKRPKQADILIEIGRTAKLFRTPAPDRDAYADIVIDGHRETWRVRSKGYVALLLRLPFLEGAGAERLKLTSGVARVHVASRRLPMMHRDGWDGPKATSAMAFAWFVWDARHRGPGQLGFFDWKQFGDGADGST
jgi:hypothetical protein